ncbi:MAG TPA: hypothetical protein VD973_06580 [Symbiobacteriaceae bacterium]|nr:hypothetical protein [Symbiobacteriaceae bacterium]
MVLPAAAEKGMPRLTVEAFAEMINMPGYSQLRVLIDQKYPKKAPAVFRTPYYHDAMVAIREFYRHGNQVEVLSAAIIGLQDELAITKIPQTAARLNRNIVVLQAFRDSALKDWPIKLQPSRKHTLTIGGVEIRFSPDITGLDGENTCYLLLNPRSGDASEETARMTLELAHHLLHQNAVHCRVQDLAYVNLLSSSVVRISSVRKRTLQRAADTASIVKRLWDTI